MRDDPPTPEDFAEWIARDGWNEGCRRFSAKGGRGWLVEDALTAAQIGALEEVSDRPPPGSVLYKFGSRSFVGDCPVGNTRLALKYYYALRLHRRIGYTIRGTRCLCAWKAGRAFRFLGIPTPEPLAMLEWVRNGILAHRSLLATRIVEAVPLPDYLERHKAEPEPLRPVFARCGTILATLARYRIYHGDLAPKNFLVGEGGTVWLIDLDAVSFLVPPRAWPRRRARDLRRFAVIGARYPKLRELLAESLD